LIIFSFESIKKYKRRKKEKMLHSTHQRFLWLAVAVLGGYIIPGYLLKRRYQQDV